MPRSAKKPSREELDALVRASLKELESKPTNRRVFPLKLYRYHVGAVSIDWARVRKEIQEFFLEMRVKVVDVAPREGETLPHVYPALFYMLAFLPLKLNDALRNLYDEARAWDIEIIAKATNLVPKSASLARFAEAISARETRMIKSRLGTRMPGRQKGKNEASVKLSKHYLETQLPKIIRELDNQDIAITREELARKLGLPNGKALYRLRHNHGDARPLREVIRDALALGTHAPRK